METKEMICIRCPLGCHLKVEREGANFRVSGNTCKRGEEYGEQEMRCPMRVVTSSVRVSGGVRPVCAVRTAASVPKASIAQVLREIAFIRPQAPVVIGQVLAEDVAGTGVRLVAAANDRKAE